MTLEIDPMDHQTVPLRDEPEAAGVDLPSLPSMFGAVLVKGEEAVMFYSPDMVPDMATVKDRFELEPLYTAGQMHAYAIAYAKALGAVSKDAELRQALTDLCDDADLYCSGEVKTGYIRAAMAPGETK